MAKKMAKKTVSKKASTAKAPAVKQNQIKQVNPGDIVNYTKDKLTTSAKVIMVHGGNALDLVIMSADGSHYALGSVKHISESKKEGWD